MKPKALVLAESQINGDDLVYAAWEVLCARSKGLEREEYTEHVRQLPPHWRAVYTSFMLEGEVNNGGHHQFFWNSERSLNKETLEDLRLISAKPFILLFEEALDVFNQHDYAEDKRESGNAWEAFTEGYKEKRMDILDTAFNNAPKSLEMYLTDYIRTNRNLYLENADPSADLAVP